MRDFYGRSPLYLRLSITDICNFKCKYCLPNGYKKTKKFFLSTKEIYHLISCFVEIGVKKIRITGGEPTVSKNFFKIGSLMAMFPELKQRVFTTNGFNLYKIAALSKNVGFNGVNVSLDSLNEKKFFYITGRDNLIDVINGIDESLKVGMLTKINVVLLKSFCQDDLNVYLGFIKNRSIVVRFIELMCTGGIKSFFDENYISPVNIIKNLIKNGWKKKDKSFFLNGPAEEYEHKDYMGKIGFISPYTNNFCLNCNRLRISSSGNLFLCLFGNKEPYFFRNYLNSYINRNILVDLISKVLITKSKSHFLNVGNHGIMQQLSSIGG